jgi:hypothetical protein
VSAWLLAGIAGVALAGLSYGTAARGRAPVAVLAALRALAVALLAAAALDAPLGRAGAAPALVALDASASWGRAADPAAFGRARDSVRAALGTARRDSLLLVGDSVRAGPAATGGRDGASRVGDAADRAAAAGRPLVLVTDGELADPDALRRAPGGSRVVVLRPARRPDAAVVDADAPRAAGARDTVEVRATVAADAAGAPAGRVRLLLGGRVLADSARAAMAAHGRVEVRLRAVLAGAPPGPVPLRIVSAAAGDGEARNDTLTLAFDVADAPAAVFASGAPDYDARLLVGILRGTLATPVRAYYRVAPGQWRSEGSLAPVSEADVRRAAAGASLLVLHGDTAVLGPPRGVGRGALALVQPPADPDSGAEWYARSAPPSPVAGALAGVPWDSLPPLDLGAAPAAGTWTALRADARGGGARAAIVGTEGTRRVLVAGAGGFWRWQFRGGPPAEAATALWGALFDWLAAGRGDARAAVPDRASVRAGEPVRWRRGGADSVVRVTLTRLGATAGGDTLVLGFPAGARTAESPARAPGVYVVGGPGGASLLAVNAGPELLPARPTATAGPVGSGAPTAGAAPRVRDAGWPYAAAAALLCAEWVLRRRRGLR